MSQQDNNNFLFQDFMDLTNDDDNPEQVPDSLNQVHHAGPDMMLRQPVTLQTANITAEEAAVAQQILAVEHPGPGDPYSPPITPDRDFFEPPFSRISTPELPEGGPEFDEAITQTGDIQHIMQGRLQYRRHLVAAREVADEHLPYDPFTEIGQVSPRVLTSEHRSSFAAPDQTFGTPPTLTAASTSPAGSPFGSFPTSLPRATFATGPTFPPLFPPASTPGAAPTNPQVTAMPLQRPTTPLDWKDITPEWMLAVRANPAPRSKPWHGKTVLVSAKEHAVPRNAVERLELFRALYPSLHFTLKQTPTEGYDLDLRQTYEAAMKKWKSALREARTETSPDDPLHQTTVGLPEIREPWFDYLEDWDVSGRDKEVQQRILTNWNHPARDMWKAQRCPLNFHSSWTENPESCQFLDGHQQLLEPGLPNIVGLIVDNDGILQIIHMANK